MEVIQPSDAHPLINAWQELPDNQVDATFKTFFSAADLDNGHIGNTDYPNQWSRLLGIKYGQVNLPFRQALQDPEAKIYIYLARNILTPDPNEPKASFTILLATEKNNVKTYYQPDSFADSGIYSIHNAPQRTTTGQLIKAHYGISVELRNQLAYNWLVSPYSVTDLFYTLTGPQQFGGVKYPGKQCWVRAHHYKVIGDNRRVLKEVVTEGSVMNIRFGVNPSDQFLDTDYFAPILEVMPASEDYTNAVYLDFLGACPPCPHD